MKGVSYWFWIVAGVIAGLVIFTIAYQQIVDINRAATEHRNIEQFYEIKNIADNLCKGFSGNKRNQELSLSENVEGIYIASDADTEYDKEKLVDMIISEAYYTGKYLCIKVVGKNLQCEELECDTMMPFIGAVPEEFSLSALVNNLIGRGSIYDYSLEFEKKDDIVFIHLKEEPSLIRICKGILDIQLSGTETCTVKAVVKAKNCKGNDWDLMEKDIEMCTGTVESDTYTTECPTWTVESGTDGKSFTYDLYIGEENRDSKSVTCNPTPQPPEPSKCSPEEIVKNVDKNIMLETIRYLSQHSRPYGSSGNQKTADYIKNKLEEYGLSNVHFEDFDSGKGRNVVGEIGSGQTMIVVTGGHRDAVSNCPGAVDNAAGAATVLEAARILSTCKDSIKQYKISFVLFDGEENGMYGSQAYVSSHSNENINSMLNFDCVGLKGSQGLTVFRTATDLSNSADKACQSIGITCEKKSQAPAQSDHAPFGQRGIPYLWAINYGYSCGTCYHCGSCQDDMSQIDGERMEWAGKFAVYVIADLYAK